MADIGVVIRYNIWIKKRDVLHALQEEPKLKAIAADIFELPMGKLDPCMHAMAQLLEKAGSLETDVMFSKCIGTDLSWNAVGFLEEILGQLHICMIHCDTDIESVYGQARVALLHALIWSIVKDYDTDHFVKVTNKWIRKIKARRK